MLEVKITIKKIIILILIILSFSCNMNKKEESLVNYQFIIKDKRKSVNLNKYEIEILELRYPIFTMRQSTRMVEFTTQSNIFTYKLDKRKEYSINIHQEKLLIFYDDIDLKAIKNPIISLVIVDNEDQSKAKEKKIIDEIKKNNVQ